MFGIVIPVYRGGKYLGELIDSLRKSSDPNWEVIIVDDSNAIEVAIEISAICLDPRFTVIKNESNLGPFASWNIGLQNLVERQKYSLISVVHEDDLLHVDYVKNSFSYFACFPNIDVYHSKIKLIGSSSKRVFSFRDAYKGLALKSLAGKPIRTFSDAGLARILSKNFIFCPSMIFNVRKFSKLVFSERWEMVGDLDFIARALLEGRTLLQLPDKNYFYRRHKNNLTAKLTRTTKRFEEELELYEELVVLCCESGFLKSAKVAKKARIIKLHIAYRMLLALVRLDFGGIRRLTSVLLLNSN